MNLDLSTHICAYLDVLGGEKLFECADVEEAEGFVDIIFDFERRLNNMRKDGAPVVRIFTDNVFAAFPLKKTGKYSIQDQVGYFLSEVVTQLQQILMFSELPVRGGITIGELYIDSRIIIGPAVVRAVSFPREGSSGRSRMRSNLSISTVTSTPALECLTGYRIFFATIARIISFTGNGRLPPTMG